MLHYYFHIEKELLTQLSAGDEQAFRDLFNRYYGKLYHYIFEFIKQLRMTVHQLSFWIQANRKSDYLPAYRTGRLLCWMKTIVKNHFIFKEQIHFIA